MKNEEETNVNPLIPASCKNENEVVAKCKNEVVAKCKNVAKKRPFVSKWKQFENDSFLLRMVFHPRTLYHGHFANGVRI